MPKKNNSPEIIKLSVNDFDGIKSRLSTNQLSDDDKKIMLSILTTYQWLQRQLQSAKFSIHRLKILFGFKTEKHPSSNHRANDLNSYGITVEPSTSEPSQTLENEINTTKK